MKKGYTLVELLAVLVILSMIISLVAINAVYYSNKRKQKDYANIVSIIEENTKVLINTNKSISKSVDNTLQNSSQCKISYSYLSTHNLMDPDTKNPITGKVIDSNSYIKITLDTSIDDYNYEFVYVDEDNPDTSDIVNCLN